MSVQLEDVVTVRIWPGGEDTRRHCSFIKPNHGWRVWDVVNEALKNVGNQRARKWFVFDDKGEVLKTHESAMSLRGRVICVFDRDRLPEQRAYFHK